MEVIAITELDWEEVRSRYNQNPFSYTKTGKLFKVSKITDTAIYINLPSGEEYISKSNLEKAVRLINGGRTIDGPMAYRKLVYDQPLHMLGQY